MVHSVQGPIAVPQKEWELRERAGRFARAAVRICEKLPHDRAGRKLGRRVSITATAVDTGYGAACVAKSPEQFIASISAVARHAQRARILLLDLVQGSHVSIDAARDLILEARALEAIFAASRNTAKRRKAADDKHSTA